MAGLYIHIPFCKSRCIYCGFYSTTMSGLSHRYVEALQREMLLRHSETPLSIETVYIGGGTPSFLQPDLINKLFIYINNVYGIDSRVGETEVTMECNPDDLTPDFVHNLRLLPVNRISIGVQTFDAQRLKFIKRRHIPEQVVSGIDLLRNIGIKNISIDLIYGFPGQTMNEWQIDVDEALKLNVEHISAYALSYEEGTPLLRMLNDGKIKEADEELQRSMYYYLKSRLELSGYEHYEISNFARRGFRSRHNSSYWNHTPYIGLGAGAHSFYDNRRTWNVADVEQYISSIEEGVLPNETEYIDSKTFYNERVMTELRTCEGLNLALLSQEELRHCVSSAKPFIDGELLEIDNGRLRLTSQGLFVSDMIICQLMIV